MSLIRYFWKAGKEEVHNCGYEEISPERDIEQAMFRKGKFSDVLKKIEGQDNNVLWH